MCVCVCVCVCVYRRTFNLQDTVEKGPGGNVLKQSFLVR